MKRRNLLAATVALPLVAGCLGDCSISKGDMYELDEGHVEVIDVGDNWANVKVDSPLISGEYHLRKLGCDDRYCRYELDSEIPAKIRFDCNDKTATIYI